MSEKRRRTMRRSPGRLADEEPLRFRKREEEVTRTERGWLEKQEGAVVGEWENTSTVNSPLTQHDEDGGV